MRFTLIFPPLLISDFSTSASQRFSIIVRTWPMTWGHRQVGAPHLPVFSTEWSCVLWLAWRRRRTQRRVLALVSSLTLLLEYSIINTQMNHMRDIEGFCDNPFPQQNNALDRKTPKRTLKNCDKGAEVWFSTIDGYWWGWGCGVVVGWVRGRKIVSFKGPGYRESDRASATLWTAQIELSKIFWFFFGGDQGVRVMGCIL